MRCGDITQPVEYVRRLPQDAGGHHRGHPEAGRHLLLQVLREVSHVLGLGLLQFIKISLVNR